MTCLYLFVYFRWAKLRAAMLPVTMMFEPFTECIGLGLLSAWAMHYLFRWDPISFFLVHILLWFLMDWILIHIVQNGSLPCNKFEFLVSKIDITAAEDNVLTWVLVEKNQSLFYLIIWLECRIISVVRPLCHDNGWTMQINQHFHYEIEEK